MSYDIRLCIWLGQVLIIFKRESRSIETRYTKIIVAMFFNEYLIRIQH